MKKPTQALVTLADHTISELMAAQRIMLELIRKGESVTKSKVFPYICRHIADAARGYQPDILLFDTQTTELMEAVASDLWRLAFPLDRHTNCHLTNQRVAVGVHKVERLDQILSIAQILGESEGKLVLVICYLVERNHETFGQLQQSPAKIICLTPVEPYHYE